MLRQTRAYNLDIWLRVGCLDKLLNITTFDDDKSFSFVSVTITNGSASYGVPLTNDHQESERVVDCGASQHTARKYP